MNENLAPNDTVGEFKIINNLRNGTFGNSWLGIDKDKKKVVIQNIKDISLINFLIQDNIQETTYNNPSIPDLIAVEQEPFFLVWEYISGRTLITYLKQLKKLKINVALYIARKILETIEFAVSKGFVHGGLRPSRIIITPDKKVAVTNYGIGKFEQRIISGEVTKKGDLDKYNTIIPYLPEEVIEDEMFDDVKSDIYSVGILLVQMITGENAFQKDIYNLLSKNNISTPIVSIIKKATTNFEERYNHPSEMLKDIVKTLNSPKNPEKFYVAPPSQKVTLDAVPADSEEYRVYQKDVYSAQQTIDADVVTAEPADMEETFESSQECEKKKVLVDYQGLKRTIRLDQDSFVESDVDSKLLKPLEKQAIWPNVFLKFFILTFFLAVGIFFASSFIAIDSPGIIWILMPVYAISNWILPLKIIGYMILLLGSIFLFFLPFFDYKGGLRNSIVIPEIISIYFFILIALGIWGIILL